MFIGAPTSPGKFTRLFVAKVSHSLPSVCSNPSATDFPGALAMRQEQQMSKSKIDAQGDEHEDAHAVVETEHDNDDELSEEETNIIATVATVGVVGVGVYFQVRDESWKAVLPEPVTRKAGGVVKSVTTEGKIKGDVNAIVMGSSSTLTLTLPASFILYTPEGSSAGEYLLLRFHAHEKNREFRLEKGGEFHRSSSEARDTVDFSSRQLGPRVFEITLGRELGAGEYGFLAPSDAGDLGSSAGYGKMYTFSVVK
jgi:hypothetical protein